MGEVDLNRELRFFDACIYKNILYFSAIDFNGCFCLKRGTSQAEFLFKFPNELSYEHNLHRFVIPSNGGLFFFPYRGKEIVVFHTEDKRIETLCFGKKEVHFIAKAPYKDGYLLISVNPVIEIYYFDIQKTLFTEIEDINIVLRSVLCAKNGMVDFHGGVVLEDILYLALTGTEHIIAVDLKRKTIEDYCIPKIRLKNMMADIQGMFWLTVADSSTVIKWSPQKGILHEYLIQGDEEKDYRWMTIADIGNYKFLLPGNGESILKYDEEKDLWIKQNSLIPNSFKRRLKEHSLFAGYAILEGHICLFPRAGNGMLVWDDTNIEFKHVNINFSKEFCIVRKKILEEELCGKAVLTEAPERGINLMRFLHCTLNKECNIKNDTDVNLLGKKIYYSMK